MTWRARSSASLLAFALATLGACTSSTSTDPTRASSEPTSSDDGAGAGLPTPPAQTGSPAGNAGNADQDAPGARYFAFLARGSCANVDGRGGTWITSHVFPAAPPSIRDTACAFQWKPSKSGAMADVTALEDLRPELLTPAQLSKTSAAPRLSPGSITAFPPTTAGGPKPTGVSGCDVCGRVLGREAFVILPVDELNLRMMMVSTDSGKLASFEVKPLAGAPAFQAFSVDLPAAPENANYTQGRFFLYEPAR